MLLKDLVIAGGAAIEIHGHTDNQGNPDKNMQLSEDRAFAVKTWLEAKSATNFPEGRIKVFAHGQTQPLASNSSNDGRSKNRRVEIILGTVE
jgi:outer membrane protein OmpA-like peptidoglycan-associated protein